MRDTIHEPNSGIVIDMIENSTPRSTAVVPAKGLPINRNSNVYTTYSVNNKPFLRRSLIAPNIRPINKQNPVSLSLNIKRPLPFYDVKEEYYLDDYLTWIHNRRLTFNDRSLVMKNLARCCRSIIKGDSAFYVFKRDANNLFMVINELDYKDWVYFVDGVPVNVFNLIKEPEICCSQLIFEPYHYDAPLSLDYNKFNIFTGFMANMVDIDYTKLEPILSYIYTVWSGSDENKYRYILSWLAYPIRYLRKSDIILNVKGGHGISIIFDFLIKFVYGPYTAGVNTNSRGKLLVCMNNTNLTVNEEATCDYAVINGESGENSYYIECENNEKFRDLLEKCLNQECGNIFYSYLRSGFEMVALYPIPEEKVIVQTEKASENNIANLKSIIMRTEQVSTGTTKSISMPTIQLVPKIPVPQIKPIPLLSKRSIPLVIPMNINETLKHKIFMQSIFVDGNITLPAHIFQWDNNKKMFYCSKESIYQEYAKWCGSDSITGNVFNRELLKFPGILETPRKTINKQRKYCVYLHPQLYESIFVINSSGNKLRLSSINSQE